MSSCKSVPRIRVDLLPSSSLDIGDVLCHVKPLPKLLAEDLVVGGDGDPLYLEDCYLRDVPPFPKTCRPPLFTLNSHRARLPFLIRPEAFELGDFLWDEKDARPLLTAPTIPRMKLVIKEQLHVQKWVDTLTLENPPKHIPWTCERPAAERKWIAEGSIFPVSVAKSSNAQCETTKGHLRVTDTIKLLTLPDQVPYSEESCVCPDASAPTHVSTESHTSSHVLIKSADVNSGILRGEKNALQTPHRTGKTSSTPSPRTLLPFGSQTRISSATPDAPLAARRGKSLSALKLKGSVIERLEYPDIPTAFRGSPGIWSPRFDTLPVPFSTDHESMLVDLKSKCTALGSEVPTYMKGPLFPQTEMTCTSLNIDEWAFARGLATFDNLSGSIDDLVPKEITADTSTFPPGDSTPAKVSGFPAHLGLAPRLYSASALQSLVSHSSDPPGDPLPPRPALVSPSTPPNVRGILKKVKSVRFDDTIVKDSEKHTPPPPSVVSSKRSSTPVPNTPKPPGDPASVKEMPVPGKNIQKRSTPRSRLPPTWTKGNEKFEPMRHGAGRTSGPSKRTLAATSVERPCRNMHIKENTSPTAAPQAEAKPQGESITKTDLRRGIEGSSKSRLSVPLRNIFRLR